ARAEEDPLRGDVDGPRTAKTVLVGDRVTILRMFRIDRLDADHLGQGTDVGIRPLRRLVPRVFGDGEIVEIERVLGAKLTSDVAVSASPATLLRPPARPPVRRLGNVRAFEMDGERGVEEFPFAAECRCHVPHERRLFGELTKLL